jgi:predicted ATPase
MVESLGQELLVLSRDQSFTFFTAIGLMLTGWARAVSGDAGDGLDLIRQGATLFRTVGQRVGLAHRAHLAEVLLSQGSVEEGLSIVQDALGHAERTGERAFVAELQRLRGEALRRHARLQEAEKCLRGALSTAFGQEAWLFALRAASDLVRLGGERGSLSNDDRDTLQTILRRFSPALASSDIVAARALAGGLT